MYEASPFERTGVEPVGDVPETGVLLDLETRRAVQMLRSRADSLVAQSASLGEPLATTYRRRARELQLEAFLLETRGAARAARVA